MTDKEKDICQTCEHYWTDFPMPLDRVISHCEILDRNPSLWKGKGPRDEAMDNIVDYPCLKCPFDSYSKKHI